MIRPQPALRYLRVFIPSFFAAYPAACRWFGFFQKPLIEKAALLVLLWIAFAVVFWLLNWWLHLETRIEWKKRKTWLAAAALSLFLLAIFHWLPPVFPSTYSIEITANGTAELAQVTAAGQDIPLDLFSGSGSWTLDSTGWRHSGTSANSLAFSGSLNAPLELVFSTGPQSGQVVIDMNGTAFPLNLTTPLPDAAIFNPFPASLGALSPLWMVWVGLLALTEGVLLTVIGYVLLTRWLSGTLAAVVPLLFLLPYATTFAGHNVTLGNDFGPFYYVYKTYLLDFLAKGQFPLWSPSEGGGYAFFSNPLAQAVYPFNILLALFYRVNGGYTRLDHQIFTVAVVCWFSLGLYVWLRSLKIDKRAAVLAALTMALSYKMTELLRFPNAAHEAAWYPWILLALTGLLQTSTWKSVWRWSAGLCVFLVCLFTAGYPYYVYYLPFLAGPYLLFMVIPRVRRVIFKIDSPDWRKFLGGFLAASLAAVLICAPYLFQMSRTITQTSGRAGDDFTHATMYPFDFQDSVESLVYPTAARPEGWFYFGALGLSLMALYLAHPRKDTLPGEELQTAERRAWPVKAALLGWLVFLSYLSYGEQSYLFLFFYKILPEFSALRGWGRLSITLLPGLALLLAFALADFESRLTAPEPGKSRFKPWMWITLTAVAVISFSVQISEFARGITDEYWELYFIPRTAYLIQTVANVAGRNIVPDPAVLSRAFSLSFMAFSLFSLLIILLVLWKGGNAGQKGSIWMWGVFSLFTLFNLWYGGSWLWNNGFSPREERRVGDYQRMIPQSLSTPRKNENSTLTLSPAFSVGSPPKWHYTRYQDFYFRSVNELSARDELLGVTDGRRFFYSQSIDHSSIENFLADARQIVIEPTVHDYTGDYLLVEVNVPRTGFFSFIDNWDENWTASVDGKPVEIELLFGTFKSIHLDAGKHEISMAYCPRFFAWANNACPQ